jgi:predicted component of type VI protein secretion system
MGTTYRLILQSGSGAGTEYPLEKTELFLGRDLGNDIVINDPEVSRRHARLILQEGNFVFEDLGSTNGTFIREQRLAAPVVLRPGEVITLGEQVSIWYEETVTDPDATIVVQRAVKPQQQPPLVPPASRAPVIPPVAPVIMPVQSSLITPPARAGKENIPTPAPVEKKRSKILIILLILVAFLVVFCVIPWIILDITNSYCSLTPGLWNLIIPGYCS